MVGETEIRGYKTMITERKRLEAQLAQSPENGSHRASGVRHRP